MGRQDAASQLQLICYPRAEFPFFFPTEVVLLSLRVYVGFCFFNSFYLSEHERRPTDTDRFRYKYKSVDNKGAQKADNQIKMRNRHLIPFSGAKCDYLKGNIRVTGGGVYILSALNKWECCALKEK